MMKPTNPASSCASSPHPVPPLSYYPGLYGQNRSISSSSEIFCSATGIIFVQPSLDAELLTRRASFRLKDILSAAAYEDRPALEVTLKQLNEVQSELLMQVFKK
jgi:hypothetical protein